VRGGGGGEDVAYVISPVLEVPKQHINAEIVGWKMVCDE